MIFKYINIKRRIIYLFNTIKGKIMNNFTNKIKSLKKIEINKLKN